MAIKNVIDGALDTYSGKLKALTDLGTLQSTVMLCAENSLIPYMIPGATVSVTKENVLKSTSLVNRRGSVKELIQARDYTVRITGTLVGPPNLFPYAQLALLNKLLDTSKTILVASTYLATFGIYRLAFRDTTFEQGDTLNVLKYTLTFESDYNYDFIIK